MSNNAHYRRQLHNCTDEHQDTARPHRRRCKRSQKQPAPEITKNAERDDGCRREKIEVSAASTPSRSNLDSFLECTTPTVHCQFLTKTLMRHATCNRLKGESVQSIPFFNLGDLWDSFDEWSAYGAEVPLYLPGGQVVMQFYVPYLSAIQIYARDVPDCCATERRLAGEESDFSDLDLRETSSEGSVNYIDRNIVGRIFPPGLHGSDTVSTASSLSSEGSNGMFQETKNKRGRLIFEYFERSAPSGRAPFADRLVDLTRQFQKLRFLKSNEVSPASWLSVAWYPIYRIPTGATMKDFAPRFLTFHSLSTTCLEDQDSEDEGRKKGEPIIDFDAYIPAASKVDEERIALPAFGLASYKCRGGFFSFVSQTERRRVLSLLSCADAWLKQLNVHHPDFDFFGSYGAFAKR